MTPRVLIVVPNLKHHGGVSNYYRELNLNSKEPNIEYFPLDYGKFKLIGIIKIFFKFYYKLKNFEIIKINPSLQKFAFIRSCFFILISKLNSKKVIIFVRGWSDNFETKISKNKIYNFLLLRLWFKSDAIIVLGSTFKSKLKSLGYKKKIFLETTISSNRIYQPKNIEPSNQINLLLISRIIKEKGIFLAVETMKELQSIKHNFNFNLIIAGDGPDLKKLKDYIKKNNAHSCTIAGYVDGNEKINLFKKSHILLFPTYHSEGMPNAIIEAISFGMPVGSRNNGGISDHIINSVNGYLTTSKNPKWFAKRIIELTDKKSYHDMSKYNLKLCNKYNPSEISVRLKRIYFEIQ